MIIVALVILGLCLGSFVNALVWRIHEQNAESSKKKSSKKRLAELSVLKGRSICPNCKYQLKAVDLIPLVSWLSTKGKCRYCQKPISPQYPLVEAATAALFVLSYVYWPSLVASATNNCPSPSLFHGASLADNLLFGLWLATLTGLVALLIYDLRWYILPNRIIYPLAAISGLYALILVINAHDPVNALINVVLAVLVGGGIFYVLFQLSGGKWIGGGDVKLGFVLGLFLATPARSLLMIFIASLLGTLISLPLMANDKLKKTSIIPFGPFLIVAAIIVQLFGIAIINWYKHSLLGI